MLFHMSLASDHDLQNITIFDTQFLALNTQFLFFNQIFIMKKVFNQIFIKYSSCLLTCTTTG